MLQPDKVNVRVTFMFVYIQDFLRPVSKSVFQRVVKWVSSTAYLTSSIYSPVFYSSTVVGMIATTQSQKCFRIDCSGYLI